MPRKKRRNVLNVLRTEAKNVDVEEPTEEITIGCHLCGEELFETTAARLNECTGSTKNPLTMGEHLKPVSEYAERLPRNRSGCVPVDCPACGSAVFHSNYAGGWSFHRDPLGKVWYPLGYGERFGLHLRDPYRVDPLGTLEEFQSLLRGGVA